MKPSSPKRPAGRPPRGAPAVSREAILSETLVLLEAEGLEGVTMRALARRLGVDPMALYHYFPDKHALLRASAVLAYGKLEPRVPPGADWKRQLEALALAYLRVLEPAGELLRYLSARPAEAAGPARLFDAHFRAAVAPLGLSPPLYRAARSAFVDFVHGFSLALRPGGARPSVRTLKAELRVFSAGVEALARR